MPYPIAVMASRLAQDDTVGSEEIADAISFMDEKIKAAKAENRPIPFIAFRTKTFLVAALRLRQETDLSM